MLQLQLLLVTRASPLRRRAGGRRRRRPGEAATVVAALVAAQRLPGRERLVADGTLVGSRSRGAAARSRGGGSRSGGAVAGRRQFPVAGLVAAEGLVRREGLVADGALVGQGLGRVLELGSKAGRNAAAGEHDKAEREILLLGGGGRGGGGALGALALGPWLRHYQILVALVVGGGIIGSKSCSSCRWWGVESFNSHGVRVLSNINDRSVLAKGHLGEEGEQRSSSRGEGRDGDEGEERRGVYIYMQLCREGEEERRKVQGRKRSLW